MKLGTSLLTKPDGRLDADFLRAAVSQLAVMRKQGHELVLVSSGAVSAGRGEIATEREKKNIPFRQALAAVGQGILMAAYHDLFSEHKISVAQALLTNYDFVNRENFLNTKNVMSLLLKLSVVPVVNENDVTTVAELKFGDNDMLSAKTAAMVSADYLVIVTDVDGLFLEDPKKNPDAEMLHEVARIDDSVRALAGGARSSRSMGGMKTKLSAAEYVTAVGIPMFVINGRRKNAISDIAAYCEKHRPRGAGALEQKLGTFFPTRLAAVESRKKWLTPKIRKNAWIEIDAGAAKALVEGGKSLLASGISAVIGDFERGDVVAVKSEGTQVAYGQVNYSSEEVEKILGYSFAEEVMHRDRMVIARVA